MKLHYSATPVGWALRHSIGLSVLVLIASGICWAVFMRHLTYPQAFDAIGYGRSASGIETGGLFSNWRYSEIRTYAYPYFISLIQGPAHFGSQESGLYLPRLPFVQTILYIASCLWVVWGLRRTLKWATFTAVGLLANPFLLAVIPLRLTDGPSLTLSIALFGAAISVVAAHRVFAQATFLGLGGLLCGTALMVRPANIALVAAWIVFCLTFIYARYRSDTNFSSALMLMAAACASTLIPTIPQLIINVLVHGQWTVLPVYELGNYQLEMGVKLLKFTSDMTKPGAYGYVNPIFEASDLAKHGVPWIYVMQPFKGFLTATLHVFNSLNHDLFFVYPYDMRPWYSPLTIVGSQTIVFAGVAFGATQLAHSWRATTIERIRTRDAAWAFLVALLVVTCLLNSVTAVETRFGLPVLAVLAPFAVAGVHRWRYQEPARKCTLLVGWLCYVGLAFGVSEWVSSTGGKPIW